MNLIKELQQERNHLYFWVRDNKLYQSYKTARGERSAFVCEVIYPDKDELSEKDINWLDKVDFANKLINQNSDDTKRTDNMVQGTN